MSNDPSVERAKAAQGIPTIGPGGAETLGSILGTQDRLRREQDEILAEQAQAGGGDPVAAARQAIEHLSRGAERWVDIRKSQINGYDPAPLTGKEDAAYHKMRLSNDWRWCWIATDDNAAPPGDALAQIGEQAATAYGGQAHSFLQTTIARLTTLDRWAQENDAAIKRFEMDHVRRFGERVRKTQRRNRILLGIGLALLALFFLPIGKLLP